MTKLSLRLPARGCGRGQRNVSSTRRYWAARKRCLGWGTRPPNHRPTVLGSTAQASASDSGETLRWASADRSRSFTEHIQTEPGTNMQELLSERVRHGRDGRRNVLERLRNVPERRYAVPASPAMIRSPPGNWRGRAT